MAGIPIDSEGRFSGYASVFNRLDSGGDIVMPGAFAKSLARKRGRIRLLFQHLLSNALKFSHPDRPPRIDIRAHRQSGLWHFTVADNGIGIEPRFQQRIFLIFQRLHPSEAYEGSGIGLAHSKKIVELYQGKIWVESVPGEGSTFHFTISETA